MQANFYGDSITKVDRKGQTQPFAASGLSGPVGMAINRQTGDVFVANCRSNSIAEIAPDGTVSSFAQSQLFNCPNGISFDRGGNLYVVNFRDNKILKVDQKGVVTPFATISQKGLGHLCFNEDRFYVTAYDSHENLRGEVGWNCQTHSWQWPAGLVDGTGAKVRLSFPNGIACNSWARRLYINEYVNDSTSSLPRRAIVREIMLGPDK